MAGGMKTGIVITIRDGEVKLCFPSDGCWVVHGIPAHEARDFAAKILAMAEAAERGALSVGEPVLIVHEDDAGRPVSELKVSDPQKTQADPTKVSRVRSAYVAKGYAYLARVP